MSKDLINVTIHRSDSDASTSSTSLLPQYYDDSNDFNKERRNSLIDSEELPQGRHLGLYSTIVLFLSRIMGSGIWAAPSNIYVGVGGNYTLYFILWFISTLIAFSGMYVYLELGSIIPRSGGTKIFLEYIYQRPKMLITVVYGTFSLLFGLTMTNSIVFGKYILFSLGYDEEFVTNSKFVNHIALIMIFLICFIHGLGLKYGIYIQNFLGFLKIFLIVVMSLTGIYVLIFPYSITGLNSNFNLDSTHFTTFKSQVDFNTISSSFINCFFVFGGWNSVHTISSEIKNPNKTLKIAGPISLTIAFFNFMLINFSYLKVLTHEEIVKSGPLIGSLLFEKIFGYKFGRQFLTISIALSSFSNVFVVIYALARMDQEILREGYLPFSEYLVQNNRVWKTPINCLILVFSLNAFWLIILPSNTAFNYILGLEGFPSQLFLLILVIGVFKLRKEIDFVPEIKSFTLGNILMILTSIFILISPLINHKPSIIPGLPSEHITGISIILILSLYWLIWFKILPYWKGYKLERIDKVLDDGLVIKKWIKEPLG